MPHSIRNVTEDGMVYDIVNGVSMMMICRNCIVEQL